MKLEVMSPGSDRFANVRPDVVTMDVRDADDGCEAHNR